MSGAERLLCAMLDCGIADLRMLDDVRYCYYDIVDAMKDKGLFQQGFNFNDVMRTIVEMGIEYLCEELEDRRKYFEKAGRIEELNQLKKLDPRSDIESFHNYLDTHVYFVCHGDLYHLYQEYMSDALENFACDTGFEIP